MWFHRSSLADYFRRSHPSCDHKIIYARCYRKLGVSKMLADDEIWTTVLSFANVDDSEECFTTILQGLLDALLLSESNNKLIFGQLLVAFVLQDI